MIKYKLNGQKAKRAELLMALGSEDIFLRWEDAVSKHSDEIQREAASVILHLNNGKLNIVTETRLLMKLYCEVYKIMFAKEAKKVALAG
jgi:hypothetical protein